MFNRTRRELNTVRSEAGQFRKKIADELNAHKSQTKDQLKKLEQELDFEEHDLQAYMSHAYRVLMGLSTPEKRTIKTVMKELTDRLAHQEKMQKMLFAHLGIEYAKITEETRAGKQEKEVLRKIKKQKN